MIDLAKCSAVLCTSLKANPMPTDEGSKQYIACVPEWYVNWCFRIPCMSYTVGIFPSSGSGVGRSPQHALAYASRLAPCFVVSEELIKTSNQRSSMLGGVLGFHKYHNQPAWVLNILICWPCNFYTHQKHSLHLVCPLNGQNVMRTVFHKFWIFSHFPPMVKCV